MSVGDLLPKVHEGRLLSMEGKVWVIAVFCVFWLALILRKVVDARIGPRLICSRHVAHWTADRNQGQRRRADRGESWASGQEVRGSGKCGAPLPLLLPPLSKPSFYDSYCLLACDMVSSLRYNIADLLSIIPDVVCTNLLGRWGTHDCLSTSVSGG